MLVARFHALVLCLCFVCFAWPLSALAQVQVLGVEIGKTTMTQVKAQLNKATKIVESDHNRYSGGPQFSTNGAGYEIDSLKTVLYIFDREQKLAAVMMTMGKNRFEDIASFLASKYKVTKKVVPFVGDRLYHLKPPGVFIEVSSPHLSFEMDVNYLRDDLYQAFNAQLAQEDAKKRAGEKAKF